MSRCLMCVAKDLTIAYQRQRITLLQREIKRLKEIIGRAKVVCASISNSADKVMSKHQPRAKWAYAKSAWVVARTIYSVLGSHHP